MRSCLKQALAVGALLAMSSSWVVGWSVALHLDDDHHRGAASDHGVALDLEMALHGHTHSEGTPAHGHPFVGGVAAPLPGKLLPLTEAMTACPRVSMVADPSGRQLLSQAGATRDPPPRPAALSILRI